MHYAKWKKSISKGYMLYDSVYLMTFWKKANGRTATHAGFRKSSAVYGLCDAKSNKISILEKDYFG